MEKEKIVKEKIVRVFVEGGCVSEVDNLPDGCGWKLIDYDCDNEEKVCGNCEKANTCDTTLGSPTCKWEMYKEERERLDREEQKIKKIRSEKLNRLKKHSELLEDIKENYHVPDVDINELCELERKLTIDEQEK